MRKDDSANIQRNSISSTTNADGVVDNEVKPCSRVEMSSRNSSEDTRPPKGKRLDQDMEQLDQHLMDVTLKNVKYMNGSKFTVFSDVAFQRDLLEAHNVIRAKHNCPPLTWNQDLADQASEWAQQVSDKGRILYKDLPNFGENISLITTNGTNHLPTGKEVTEIWAKQSEKFDFSCPKWSIECQNFTQLIWKSTQQVGASRVWLQSKGVVAVVGFYYPRGNRNFSGEFQKNVLPPREK